MNATITPKAATLALRAGDATLEAELIERLRRTTFLLDSARLVIADEVARRIASDAVGEARATLAKVAP